MIPSCKHVSLLRYTLRLGWLALFCAVLGEGGVAFAQPPKPAVAAQRDVQLAVTFEVSGSNLVYARPATSFLFGGGAELSVDLYKGIGVATSLTGLHTSNSGQGVPINLLAFTIGPRYTYTIRSLKHKVSVYGQGLVGEMNGFDGLYPAVSGPTASANSLAIQIGGGVDIGISRHISFRVVNADWLRSTLPDGTTNVENNLRLGTGIVLHSAAR